MKKITLFIMALLCLFQSQFSLAQEQKEVDTTLPAGHYTVEHVFEQIDFSEVSSGILLDKATPFINLKRYDGIQLTDTNLVNPLKFGLIYGTLLDGNIGSSYNLPDPTTLPDLQKLEENDTIPILFLHNNYHSLDTNAITNNLFNIQNNQIYDVANRATSPYIMNNTFIAAPWIETAKIVGDTISFTIPNGGIVSNSSALISSIEVDFGDGNGKQVVQENDVISVIYTQEGMYDLESVLTLSDGTELRSHSKFEIQFPQPQYAASPLPPTGGMFDLTTAFDIPISGAATVTGLSSCCDDVLRKPIVTI